MPIDADHLVNLSNAAVEEAYKVLAVNIRFCGNKRRVKVIAITSYGSGEGKTTTAINLAVTMARSGLKVLLVDADLRKPKIMQQLGTAGTPGLSNYLTGLAGLEEIVLKTSIPNFHFTGCGPIPSNSLELLGTERFSRFLEFAAEQYNMVVIDTPPLGSVIDCALIASHADGAVIVAASDSAEYKNIRKVKNQLKKANARVLGIVLNKVGKKEYKEYFDDSYYNHPGKSDQRHSQKARNDPERD